MHDETPSGIAIKDRTLAYWRNIGQDTTIEQETVSRKFRKIVAPNDAEIERYWWRYRRTLPLLFISFFGG